jgi:hypothetical protein
MQKVSSMFSTYTRNTTSTSNKKQLNTLNISFNKNQNSTNNNMLKSKTLNSSMDKTFKNTSIVIDKQNKKGNQSTSDFIYTLQTLKNKGNNSIFHQSLIKLYEKFINETENIQIKKIIKPILDAYSNLFKLFTHEDKKKTIVTQTKLVVLPKTVQTEVKAKEKKEDSLKNSKPNLAFNQKSLLNKNKNKWSTQTKSTHKYNISSQSNGSILNLSLSKATASMKEKLNLTTKQYSNGDYLSSNKISIPVLTETTEKLTNERKEVINKNLINDLEAIYFEDKVKSRSNSQASVEIPKLNFNFNFKVNK